MVLPEPAEPAPVEQGTEFARWVQSSLNQVMNLRLPVDGIMGPETRSAVRDFQRQEGLPEDGIVGPDTERALITARTGRPAQVSNGTPPEQEQYLGSWWGSITGPRRQRPQPQRQVDRTSRAYIQWVQRALNRIMGLRLVVDGISGPQTRSAVRDFQRRNGLAVDGIVGPQTEAALVAAGAASPPQSSRPSYTTAPPVSPPTGSPHIVNVRGIQVARSIAPQVNALLVAAKADGIRLSGGGYRTSEEQIELRKQNCGTTHYDIYEKPSKECSRPTARPGTSNHEKGLAIDFRYNDQKIESQNNPAFRWLSQNAARFGLYNLASEPWHWSVDGR